MSTVVVPSNLGDSITFQKLGNGNIKINVQVNKSPKEFNKDFIDSQISIVKSELVKFTNLCKSRFPEERNSIEFFEFLKQILPTTHTSFFFPRDCGSSFFRLKELKFAIADSRFSLLKMNFDELKEDLENFNENVEFLRPIVNSMSVKETEFYEENESPDGYTYESVCGYGLSAKYYDICSDDEVEEIISKIVNQYTRDLISSVLFKVAMKLSDSVKYQSTPDCKNVKLWMEGRIDTGLLIEMTYNTVCDI